MLHYYDPESNRINISEWCALMSAGVPVVAQTPVGGYLVSTAWVGIDYGTGPPHPPLIYETLIFKGNRVGLEQWSDEDAVHRWTTRTQALAGHDQIVARIRTQALRSRRRRKRDD